MERLKEKDGNTIISQRVKKITNMAGEFLSSVFNHLGIKHENKILQITEQYPIATQLILQKIAEKHISGTMGKIESPLNEVRILLSEENSAFSPNSLEIINYFDAIFHGEGKKDDKYISSRKMHINNQLKDYPIKKQEDIEQEVRCFFDQYTL